MDKFPGSHFPLIDPAGLFDRRRLIGGIAVAAAGAMALSTSRAPTAIRLPDEPTPPARRPLAPVAGLRPIISIFDVMTPAAIAGAKAGANPDDSPAFEEALAAAAEVIVPPGIFHVAEVNVPNGRRLRGTPGASRLVPPPGKRVARLLWSSHGADVGIADLALAGDRRAQGIGVFSDVHRLALAGLEISGAIGHSLMLDACTDAAIDAIAFGDTGSRGGYAALSLVNWNGPGFRNHVNGITGDRVLGRLIGLFGQVDCSVANVRHVNVRHGEAVYFLDCLRCSMDRILHLGGGAGQTGIPNPGNDGCAMDGGCRHCSATNGRSEHNSGHGLSINGTRGFPGASHSVVRNWIARFPDEGGVVISDQGVLGSSPSHNLVRDCLVENPGARVTESAFSCFGGYDNQFIGCTARDTRRPRRMTVGYEEGAGVNGADRNSWQGRIGRGETLRAPTVIIGRQSRATER